MIPVLIAAIADHRARTAGRHGRFASRPARLILDQFAESDRVSTPGARAAHTTPAGSEDSSASTSEAGLVTGPAGDDPAGLADAPTAAAAIAGGRGATEKDPS